MPSRNVPSPVGRVRQWGVGLGDYLRGETVGGVVLIGAIAVALVLANSPVGDAYAEVLRTRVGPESVHLHLELATWAADGLLAVFFFVVGLEIKHELVTGELRDPRTAALPVLAAVAGMVVPALVFLAVSAGAEGSGRGWAVPMATDIAVALGVLALAGSNLPVSLRLFLLSLAVVDDLGAILIIALAFSAGLSLAALAGAALLLAGYALLQRRGVRSSWVYVPLGIGCWTLVHESGVHATVAGVALGLLTRTRPTPGENDAPTVRLRRRLQPWSAGVAVPLFALSSAGVPVSAAALTSLTEDRVAIGVAAGLLAGKLIGILGGSWLAVRMGLARLPPDLHWRDIGAVAVLAGTGFTVSLLIADLAYGSTEQAERVKAAVLLASAVAAGGSAFLLRRRVSARAPDPPAAASPVYSAAEGQAGRQR